MMKNITYPFAVMEKLSAAIGGDDDAQQWLVINGYTSLADFSDAVCDDEKAFRRLAHGSDKEFAAAVDALNGKGEAKKWLILNGYRELAAMCDAVDENKTAVMWLNKFGHAGWLLVAKAINKKIKDDNKKDPFGFLGSLLWR
ncbi:MAG TPA: hypothetical protein VI757_14510 [Bacteroidia bacterium]|nr:hypothetical protein [Bacteroidia bacterium]